MQAVFLQSVSLRFVPQCHKVIKCSAYASWQCPENSNGFNLYHILRPGEASSGHVSDGDLLIASWCQLAISKAWLTTPFLANVIEVDNAIIASKDDNYFFAHKKLSAMED